MLFIYPGDAARSSVDGHLAVTIGAVVTAHQLNQQQAQDFCDKLSKGLLPPRELLTTSRDIELIYDGVKYSLTCSQVSSHYFDI